MGHMVRHRAAVVLLFLLCVGVLAGGVWSFGYRAALDQLARRGTSDLALAADGLRSDLQRYRELGVLLADRPVLSDLAAGQGNGAAARAVLVSAADKTGALDIVLVDRTGRELAAASPTPAQSHAGTPYFERAMDGALGSWHQVSPRYGRRTFSFAAPIFRPDGPVGGAVVVVTDVEEVESGWRGDRPTILFTDALGVVFLSNRSELVYRRRSGDPAAALSAAEYPTGRIAPFIRYHGALWWGHDVWTLDGGRYLPSRALHLTLPLPAIALTAEALVDVAPAQQLAALQASVAAALCLAFGALLFLATERRRALADANSRLEVRVADRTEALSRLNADLRREVAERTAAEAALKRAQADLVQAGKLSALGQMSAGISHELNQPLMAIRSFAENAEALIGRGKPEVAAQNLARISELARRMGRIIRNLRAFARQESEALSDVDLVRVIDTVLEMVEPRVRQAEVSVVWVPPPDPVLVRGGEVRLGQVILNLITNAIDAMEGAPVRRIEMTLSRTAHRVELTVRDTGPGIAEPDRIFDPFYTTKMVTGDGMGLGLSISYGLVQSFGGAIRGRNHSQGGAVFVVELDAVAQAVAA